MGINVALVTDMDVKPQEWTDSSGHASTEEEIKAAKSNRWQSLVDFKNEEVEVFVSPNWTLEYEISLSSFRKEFYKAMLWAEKMSNSQSGMPQESKAGEVDAMVGADFAKWLECWNSDPRKNEKIAFELYKRTMLEKRISKAVTAQVFAEHLEDRLKGPDARALSLEIQGASSLQYLLDAIYHVTESREFSLDN
jgi:putative ATP-dependent endonuclease of OLD family